MIIDETGIQRDSVDTIIEKIVNVFKEHQQLQNTSSSAGAMNFIRALTQLYSDVQDWQISQIQQLGESASGEYLDIQAMYQGLKRSGGSKTLIVIQVVTTGAGTINKDNFIVTDTEGNNYVPENEVIFEGAETRNVNFVATVTGAIKPSSLNSVSMKTPLSFISEVHNNLEPSDEYIGSDGESDPAFRKRKQESDSVNSRGMKKSIDSQIAELNGVIGYKSYSNSTDKENELGIPPYTFYLIVDGGEVEDIAQVLVKNIGLIPMKGSVHYTIDNEVVSFDRTNTITFYTSFKIKLSSETLTEELKTNIKNKMAELAITNKTFKVSEEINTSQIHELAIQALEELSLEGAVFDVKIGSEETEINKDILKTTLLNDKFSLASKNIIIENYD